MIKNLTYLALIVVLLSGCVLPEWTETPAGPTETPTGVNSLSETPVAVSPTTSAPTLTPTLTNTARPTDTPTPVPTDTPTETETIEPTAIPTDPIWLTPINTPEPVPVTVTIKNPGFELGWTDQQGGQVGEGWYAWGSTGEHTNYGDTRLPEWKMNHTANRVHEGYTAQTWFNTFSPGYGGVFQVVTLPAGCQKLVVSGWVQAWSANEFSRDEATEYLRTQFSGYARVGWGTDGKLYRYDPARYTSDRMGDDLLNLYFQIGVGGPASSEKDAAWSEIFGYKPNGDDTYQIYDYYTLISAEFDVHQYSAVRVFFASRNVYGFVHNDRQLDSVSAVCYVPAGG